MCGQPLTVKYQSRKLQTIGTRERRVEIGFVYRGSVGLQKFLLGVFADAWTVSGVNNVPLTGRLIVVANHLSYADPSVVATALPRPVQFLAKDTLFANPISGWFLRSYGAYPIKRTSIDVAAYRWARRLLEADKALVIFPEGTRGRSGLRSGLPGVTRLALATCSPLLPVGITGTSHLGAPYRLLCPTGRIGVNIGEPFSLPNVDQTVNKEIVNQLTNDVMCRISALLPAHLRGVYEGEPSGTRSDLTTRF